MPPTTTGREIHQLFSSLKHLKNLSKLYFILPETEEPAAFTDKQVLSLNKALKNLKQRNLQIKLSFNTSFFLQSDLYPRILMSSFHNIKKPISFELTCISISDLLSDSQLFTRDLKHMRSLSQFSLIFDDKSEFVESHFGSLEELLEDLTEIKSLKTSRIYFKGCGLRASCNSIGKRLLPALKKVVQTQNVEIVFNDAFFGFMLFKKRAPLKSIKNLHHSNKIKVRFIYGAQYMKMFVFIFLILFAHITIIIDILIVVKVFNTESPRSYYI